jgi:hypothetical protein
MGAIWTKSDTRGSVDVEELRPGHLWIRVQGHLTPSTGGELPSLISLAAGTAEPLRLLVDARRMHGYDRAVVGVLRAFLAGAARAVQVTVATRGLQGTVTARTAALFVRQFGMELEVVTNELDFETRMVRARRTALFSRAA